MGRGGTPGADKAICTTDGRAIPYVFDLSSKVTASFKHLVDTGTPIKSGLLYYTQTDSMHQVPAGMRDIRASIMLRNKLAQYTSRQRVGQEYSSLEHALGTDPTHNGTAQEPYFAAIRQESPAATLVGLAGDRQSARLEVNRNLEGTDCYSSNEVPAARRERPILPPTIDSQLECERCYASDTCMLYRRVSRTVHNADPRANGRL